MFSYKSVDIIKFIIIILGIFFISLSSFSIDFEKDLKKTSKLNSFVDNKGKKYELVDDINQLNTLIIIFTHGDRGQEGKIETCKPKWNKIPRSIYQLDGSVINGLKIRTYQLCNGVRGWSRAENDKFWDTYWDSGEGLSASFKLVDSKNILLIDKHPVILRQKVIKMKVEEFEELGYNNIILAGHSAGAWDSITLKSQFPSKIDGVIALSPARSGKWVKSIKKNDADQSWIDHRNLKISWINIKELKNILAYTHDFDDFENTESLSFLNNNDGINFINLTASKCIKGKNGHQITLTKCWNENKDTKIQIIKYLEGLSF